MSKFFIKIKQFFNRNLLPQGISAFEPWAADIIKKAGLPDNDSVKFSVAVMVLHLPSECASKPKSYFIRCLQKAAANQVVSQIIQDLKAKQDAAQKAAQQPAEVTATVVATSDAQAVQS